MTDLRIAKDRLLYMYSRLVDGKMLYKKEEAQRFGCSLRSIQRDIEDLRSFLHEQNEASKPGAGFGLQPKARRLPACTAITQSAVQRGGFRHAQNTARKQGVHQKGAVSDS